MFEWIQQADQDLKFQQEVCSFEDYMKKVEENPFRECRPSFQYLSDMIQHFGLDEDQHYQLFAKEDREAPPVFGQNRVQKAIFQNLVNFREEGCNNKFILLVGPNGSSKSSIVKKLIRGAESYSQTSEGALYTFSWVFPIENLTKGSLGLSKGSLGYDLNTFAHLEDRDILAILNSEMKDHPLLLIPLSYRQKILEDLLDSKPEALDVTKKSYLYHGDLSKRNRMIYDALLKNYKGQHSEVLKHIRVERFEISKRYSTGAVTIEPQIHIDAQMQQITMDKRLASLPSSLQSLNLFSLKGELVLANRGILEYSDLLKRPLESYKYLLTMMETKNINLQGILTELDIFFIGTSNEVHLAAFKQHPDINSFKGRFHFIRVPYLLNYEEEKKIYQDQIQSLKNQCHFEPHALTALCLFAVMTRLRSPQTKNYADSKFAQISAGLNPLEKALLLAHHSPPTNIDSESQQSLVNQIEQVENEFELEDLYEGKFGISPRDLKNIIYKLANQYRIISFLEIIKHLQKIITKKSDYEFLNMNSQGDYHNPSQFLILIQDHCFNIFDKELRESLGMIDNRSYESYIQRYIENIKALIKGEKIKNKVTGQFEESDQFFIQEFENNIEIKENAENFRSHLLSKLGAYSLDHPGVELNYMKVFPELYERLKESFRNEQKKAIQNISKNLVFFETQLEKKDPSPSQTLNAKNRQQIEIILKNLKSKYHYSDKGALAIIKQFIKERY